MAAFYLKKEIEETSSQHCWPE